MRKTLLFVVLSLLAPSLYAQTATVDWTNVHQVIDGFGANDFNEAGAGSVTQLTPAQAAFFFGTGTGQIGLSVLRTGLPDNKALYSMGNCTTISMSCAGSYLPDIQTASTYGVRIYVTPFAVPDAYSTLGSGNCNGALAAGHYADFATWMANFVKSIQTNGSATVLGVTLQNEPDFCGGSSPETAWSATQIATFIASNLGPTFSSAGLSSVLILEPETSKYGNMNGNGYDCTPSFTPACNAYLGGYSFHDYDAHLTLPDTMNATPLPSSGWTSPGGRYYMSEVSCQSGGSGPSWCNATIDPSITNAMAWAAELDQRFSVDGINEWAYWWFLLPQAVNSGEALYYTGTTPTIPLRTYVIGQYSRFIRPGYVRIDATHNPQTNVSVSAYQNAVGGNLVIVASNYTGSPVTQTFSIVHAPTFNTVTPYRTSATEQMVQLTNQGVSSNSFSYTLPAQSVTTFVGTGSGSGNTITPPDCSLATWSGLQAQLNPLSGTVFVNFPTCNNAWTGTSGVTINVPAAITNLTLAGQTAVNCTGAPGTQAYSCTATDNSVIQDEITANTVPLKITTGAPSTFFRFTGLTFQGGPGGANKSGCLVNWGGSSQNFRVDHNHFNVLTYNPSFEANCLTKVNGRQEGVVDHNVYDMLAAANVDFTNAMQVYTPTQYGTDVFGDGSWGAATNFGSSHAIFSEGNQFNGGYNNDCYFGARYVSRYNTSINPGAGVQAHPTYTSGGRDRGCRSVEVYHNYYGGGAVISYADAYGMRGATGLFWNNTIGAGFGQVLAVYTDRATNNHPVAGNPNPTTNPEGWGWCGTNVPNFNGSLPGAGSSWDANVNPATGYPCLDGVGRGQEQPLNGADFIPFTSTGPLNTVTGTKIWPQQFLEPLYMWGTTNLSSAPLLTIQDPVTRQNVDVFIDNASFNGTTGVGVGTLPPTSVGAYTNAPNCTAGPGGTYYTSPTGSYGVGYFDTTNQTLYVCTATNVWTQIYTPYTYPHPLTVPVVSIAPTIMNFGSVVVGASSSTQTAILTNGTSSTITLSPVTITGSNPSDFSIGANSCNSGSVAANGGTCSVTMQFAPTSTGARSATLNVNTSAGTFSVSMSGTGTSAVNPGVNISPAFIAFGNVSVGAGTPSTTVTITSTTSANLVMGAPPATISGVNAGDFTLTPGPGVCTSNQSLSQSQSCVENVMFAPAAVGSRTAQLNIFNNVTGSPQTVALSGTGVGTVALNPASINFGLIAQGQTSAGVPVTLTNNTGVAITLTGTAFVNADFTSTSNTCNSGSLGNGSSCSVTITFRPSATTGTNETGFLNITFTGVGGSPAQVPLAGTVLPPIGTPATNIFASNLAGCGVAKMTTFCFTATGKIYVATCNPTCTAFGPLTMQVTGVAQQ